MGLGKELITAVCKVVEGISIPSATQGRFEIIYHILQTCIGKCCDTKTIGSDSIVSVFHTDQQQDTVIVFSVSVAVIIIEIVCIFL